jgi:hypothetical protein
MPRLRQLFNAYRLFWLAAVLLFAAAIWWLLMRVTATPPFTAVSPEDVQSTEVAEQNPPEPSIEKLAGPLSIDVEQAELSLSSADGQLKMRVWADSARKKGDLYELNEGALQFSLKDRSTLLLRVSDAQYRYEAGVAYVSGTLVGSIIGTEQYFSAEKLSWDQVQSTVTAETVRYAGPHVEVTGTKMIIDLVTGKIRFDGQVQAAI